MFKLVNGPGVTWYILTPRMYKHFADAAHKIYARLSHRKTEAGSWKNLLLHTSFTLTFTSALSYALGLVRDKTFAFTLGAGSELDIYNAAFVVPDFLFAVLVSGALSAAFVPIFTTLDEKNRSKAIVYTNQILSFMLMALSIFGVLFAIFLPQLVNYLVPGFTSDQQTLYITTTRVLLIAPFFFTFSNTFGNALLSTGDFLWYGLSPVLYNVGIIIGVMVLVPILGIHGLVIGTVLGAFLHMLIRGQAFWRHGYRPKLSFTFSPEIRETLFLMLPKIVQIAFWQAMLWWFVGLASRTGEGGVTIYNFAYNFQSLPVSLIGIAIALASYARFSHLAAHKDYKTFSALVKKESFRIVGITAVAAIALAIFSRPLVTLLLGGGKFGIEAVTATALLIQVYAFSVPLESLMHLLARAHYALKNTLRPSLIHIFAITLSILVSGILLPRVGLFAMPIAFSAGFAIQSILLSFSIWQLLRQRQSGKLKLFQGLRGKWISWIS